jgi:TolA-binding protein
MTFKPAHIASATVLGIALSLGATPALAANKDMIQLQTQVQQLQDAVARLQQSNDERMGVLKDLVQQSADSVNRMSLNMDALQKQMRAQQDAQGGKLDQVSTQIQAMNDSLDEMKARIARLDKAMQDLQNQQQTISAAMQSSPAAASGTAPAANIQPSMPDASSAIPGGDTPAPVDTAPVPTRRGKPNAGVPASAPPMAGGGPPIEDLYKTALTDYMAAKYPLASAEFSDVVRAYPDSPLSGNAYYYMGEIDYRAGRYAAAQRDYDHVIEQFPGNAKIPASHLHKAQALILQKQEEAGIRELRTLIARFPNSSEASQARSKLNAMGATSASRR